MGIVSILVKHSGLLFRAFRASLDIFVTNEFKQKVRCEGEVDLRWPLSLIGGKYITVGNKFRSEPGLRCECLENYRGKRYSPKLVIGNYVSLGYRCHIGCVEKIVIGDHVLFGSNILIIDHDHGRFVRENKEKPWIHRDLYVKGPIHIEDNVWIGDNVVVVSGVTIGRGSVIGANSVVTHDIPPYSMAVGCPARVIKSLEL